MTQTDQHIHYIDIYERSELPPLPAEYRYIDFSGGSKEVRCFILPKETARCVFMEEHEHLLDEAFIPIYKNKGICVRQDTSYALPGFYILSLSKHYRAFDEIDEVTYLRFSMILREVRIAMRKLLNISYVHLHYEEKPDLSCNVHFWLVPIEKVPVIYSVNIRDSFAKLSFRANRKEIIECNDKMKDYFTKINLESKDNALTDLLLNSSQVIGNEVFV